MRTAVAPFGIPVVVSGRRAPGGASVGGDEADELTMAPVREGKVTVVAVTVAEECHRRRP